MAAFGNLAAAFLLSSLALCFACTPEPFVGRVSHSRYFEYHDREAQPLCPELLPALDAHAEAVGPIVGFQPGTTTPNVPAPDTGIAAGSGSTWTTLPLPSTASAATDLVKGASM